MPKKLIIEVRLNEYASRRDNPHVPWTIDEIVADAVACHDAGAAIIHFHARTADGAPENGFAANAEIVRRIRDQCDAVIHPTIGASANLGSAADRLSAVERMVREDLPVDLIPLDFVTTNIDMMDEETHAFRSADHIYTNTTGTLTHFAERLRELGIRPYPVAWNLTSVRQAIAFVRSGLIDRPMFMQLMLSSGKLIFMHPGTVPGIKAYTDFFPDDIPVEWNIVHTGGSIMPLLDHVVQAGGNLCFGLGDHPYVELGRPTNAKLVQTVAQAVRERGREIASSDEARAAYGIPSITALPSLVS